MRFISLVDNLDLFSVGMAVAAIAILGFVVFYNDRKSVTNRAFLLLSVMTVLWSVCNYVSHEFRSPILALWLVRTAIFFAVWHAYANFHFAYVFPAAEKPLPRWYLVFVLPLTFIVSFLNLTPFVFKEIASFYPDGGVSEIVNGPGIALFGLTVTALNAGGVFLFLRKTLQAPSGKQRRSYEIILAGLLVTLLLILTFNFIFPALLGRAEYVSLGAVFIFPFIATTAYAIIKHRLLDIKVISTEVLTFILAIAILFEVILSEDVISLLYRLSIFLLVLGVGILLIKSVQKEVRQREEVTKLAESLEKANIRLQELDKQKTEFLSIASHQLRTPLSIIKGYIELIGDGAYGKPTQKLHQVLSDMDESNERLVKLVDEFLDISRIEQGRTKFSFAMKSMNEVIASVVKELVERAENKGLRLAWKETDGLPEAWIDDDKIRHVVFNFVDNAIKYSETGTVTIFTESDGEGVIVRVRDQGLGFGKEDEVNFFQKFYRGENVKENNVTGTGLGLYVCRKFIEAHDGRVWAKSPGLGQGGEFGFWVPFHCNRVSGEMVDNEKVADGALPQTAKSHLP